MQEYQNSDPSVLSDPISSQHPKLNSNRFDSTQSGGTIPAGIRAPASGRVEANTALIKIGQNSGEHSPFESGSLLDGNSGITPPEEDDEGGEATSARIAQEYRRQVRIKRLAEEIQQAEREKKKEEELRRKTETQLRKTNSTLKKKSETAKLEVEETTIAPPTEVDVNIAKKRAVAMSAFKNVAHTRKSRAGLLVVLIIIFVISLSVGGGWVFLNKLANQREQANKDEVARRAQATQATQLAQQKAVQDVTDLKAREAELTRQKLVAEEVAHRAEAEKHALEERVRAKELEQQKVFLAETARRAAEDRRLREENDKVVAQANREKEELRAKIEEAQRISREKLLKKQQDEEAAKAALLASQAAAVATANAEVSNTDAPKVAVATPDTHKELPSPDTTQPQAVKNSSPKDVQTSSNDVRTTTAESAALSDKTDKLDLPSGGVRLLVKASDPYGGKLAFQWRQVKGEQVDIVDPAASKFVDGKWVSQTYFVAHQPGSYEFEVIVKNDDGVESKRKFPIEVLPPTTLK